MKYTVESDIGKKRSLNEDCATFIQRPDHYKLALVADGMGGHNAGDIASNMAVSEFEKQFQEADGSSFISAESKRNWLLSTVKTLNQTIYQYSLSHEECSGMGTTMIAVLIDGTECTICHIGDSRVYLFSMQGGKQLTRDHSYVNVLLENGEISEEEAKNHPKKNFILKALGTEDDIEPDFYDLMLQPNDYLLLCSDGLSNKLSTEDLHQTIFEDINFEEKGKKLVQLANDGGGEDNISLVLLLNDEEV